MSIVHDLASRLQDPHILRSECYIDGSWRSSRSAATKSILNPATGSALTTVPLCGAGETREAIEAAARALPDWTNRTAKERAMLLRRWFELMQTHIDDLSMVLSAEQGKSLTESRAEILYSASYLEWFAEEARRIYGDIVPSHAKDKRILVLRQPIGVVAAITPWNFPSAMIARKCAPALSAGCTFVCKPAIETPLSALALAELAARAGIPPGVFNVVTGMAAEEIGREMTSNRKVRKLSFTGSTDVGRKLMAQCADQIKKVTLELGGNAPFVVFEDADLNAAVEGAVASKFRNSGQTCVCTNRLLIHTSIYDEFASRLVECVRRLRVGSALHEDIDQGPLINERAVRKIEAHIADALERGGRLLIGGRRHSLGGTFFEPTVISEATPQMAVAQEEVFGPVACLFRFRDEGEAIRLANDTEAGLAAYVYTRELSRAWRVTEALETGMVGLNTGLISTEVAPFGGIKSSGMGREGSKYGTDDYVQMKYVCVAV